MALRSSRTFGVVLLCALLRSGHASTQQPVVPPPSPTQQAPAPDTAEPPHPKGQIIIQSHGDAPQAPAAPADTRAATPPETAKADVSDAERGAVLFLSYDLDAQINLAQARLSMRARVEVQNDGALPLKQIPLQISSSLRWDSATLLNGAQRTPLVLAQHRLDTDADHTGAAQEAVLPLPEPLAPGASASLDLFYSGTMPQAGGRLARLGANPAQQQDADWDGISPSWTGLRGFGNVLWYPTAAPQLFLAEGNTLFTTIARTRLREQKATVRLRVRVEYTGEPPAAVYFCGRRMAFKAMADDPDAPTSQGNGIASAEFAAQPLGFRLPSLFVIEEPETLVGGSEEADRRFPAPEETTSSSSSSNGNPPGLRTRPAPVIPATDTPVVALASADPGAAAGLGAAADHAASLLADWLGPRPLSALTVLDHQGQPFQDGPLLVGPAATLQTSPEAPALVYSLTHAWVQTDQPWIDEGLAQFFALLWVERDHGREAAVAQLAELMQPVALAEPEITAATAASVGQPLIAAPDELFYRRKAAGVWWMLRDIVGEKPLRAALQAWRTQPESRDTPEVQALAFEHLLEHLSGKDLEGFFADWVLRDRGLPDLSITGVATSQTPAGAGHSTGWLVAVSLRNEGAAMADVPLTVRSGQFSTTQRVRIPGLAQVTERVLVEAVPSEVVLNDGGTPEQRTSLHSRVLDVRTH